MPPIQPRTEDENLFATLVWATSFTNGLINELMDERYIVVDKTSLELLAKLCAVSGYLESDEGTISNPQTEDLAKELVSELEIILTWPSRSKKPTRPPVQGTLRALDKVRCGKRDEPKQAVAKFLSQTDKFEKEEVIEVCKLIISQLPPDPPDEVTLIDEESIPQHTTEKILAAIWNYSACDLCEDIEDAADIHVTRYHPARLYLGRPLQTGDIALFDIVVSVHSLQYWQEIGVRDSHRRRVRFTEESQPSSQQDAMAEVSSVCNLLEEQNYARILMELRNQQLFQDHAVHQLQHDAIPGEGITLERVLQEYNLSVTQKVALSHTIALAFWQFYDTKMMLARWTSRNIWFMPHSQGSDEQLPCKAYISFPFDRGEYELEEYSTFGLIHKCPRIFALAVLLLEISLARPIRTCQLRSNDKGFVGQMNRDYSATAKHLTELRRQSWGNYRGKRRYDLAIEACMTGSNFLPNPQAPQAMMAASRRSILYEEVVSRLQKLANSFAQGSAADITRKINPPRGESIPHPAVTVPEPMDEFVPSTAATYHTTSGFNPGEWLQGLKEIGLHVYKLQRAAGHSSPANAEIRPVRVAILDSGCNLETPYFEDDETSQRKGRIKCWKDFFHQSTEKQDSYGHGTLMAKLVIETAVSADLYVARVSDNGELAGRERTISEAIEWAGIESEADIISMAFGVDDDEGLIQAAIVKVRQKRQDRVIFLAAAGNSGVHEDVARPASYGDVISIRAADSLGTMAATNPATDPDGPVSFSTFGDKIPLYLCDYKPEICLPGSSVSTAVAAGIAANMLLYAQLILSDGVETQRTVKKLRSVEGMRALFRKMSTPGAGRTCFINPVHFFTSRKTKLQRLCAIIDSLKV